jgi:hypothetical protein
MTPLIRDLRTRNGSVFCLIFIFFAGASTLNRQPEGQKQKVSEHTQSLTRRDDRSICTLVPVSKYFCISKHVRECERRARVPSCQKAPQAII